MPFLDRLPRAVVVAPMTKGSNLPYRQLCVELGASVTVSEMTVARRLKQRRRSEFALIRRFDGEPCFGVQLAGTNPDEMAWAAALAVSRGSEFVDVNLGCPIDYFTRKGLGAALGRQPARVARIVAAMRAAIDPIPVTVKIRLGWNDRSRNYLELAKAAVDAGAAAVTVHGRTRDARYRHAAEWDVIGEIAAALPVPVIGNGDLLFGHEIAAALERSGCAAVMVARGALIRPWLFREIRDGYHPLTAGDRLAIYRRYVELALAHWGGDEHGRTRVREFLLWHLGFWCREAPQRPDGSWPTMQGREPFGEDLLPIEQLLRRSDAAAHEWLADRLMGNDDDVDPRKAPAPQETEARGAELEAHG